MPTINKKLSWPGRPDQRTLAPLVKSRASESAEKLRGAYYTPDPIADYLAAWALAHGPARVLEPCCGDGAFLRAIARRAPVRKHSFVIDAVELDGPASVIAKSIGPTLDRAGAVLDVTRSDFFAWLESQPPEARWEAVLGNPPYIRYQYLDAHQRELANAICERAGVKLSGRTNAWVPFVVATAMRLAPGGRLAMVVPTEILHVLHADGLRRLLEREMSAVSLVHLSGMVFPGVLQGVVLLLATRRRERTAANREDDDGGIAATARFQVVDVQHEAALPAVDALDAHGIAPLQTPTTRLEGRWMRALLSQSETALLVRIEQKNWARPFTDMARVDIGVVTGANNFFVVDVATLDKYELRDVAIPIIGRSDHAKGITYSPRDHARNAREGQAVHLLQIPAGARSSLTAKMREYLKHGETEKLHTRYKTRIRDPWWVVPYVWVAPVAMLKRAHGFTRLLLNTSGATSTDTVYRIRLAPSHLTRGPDIVFSFINSLTLLLSELEGRSYGGGVLEMVPSEIERLRIPLVHPTAAQFTKLDAMVRAGTPIEEILAFTDPLILGRHGAGGLAAKSIATIHGAWQRLRDRRLRVVQTDDDGDDAESG